MMCFIYLMVYKSKRHSLINDEWGKLEVEVIDIASLMYNSIKAQPSTKIWMPVQNRA